MISNPLLRGRWPAFSKPKDDELLSSWLVRLAMSHGLESHTFCSLTWPRKVIWNRDVDNSADNDVLTILAKKTDTSIERVRATTLNVYEGVLYTKQSPYRNAPWIMPIAVYYRVRRRFGLQFCPHCLEADEEPYFRRCWRLAFITLCPEHNVMLHDRCPQCGMPVNFHHNELGEHSEYGATSLTVCHACKFELRNSQISRNTLEQVCDHEIQFQVKLVNALCKGRVKVNGRETVYAHSYFMVLHQLMRIMATGRRAADLRAAAVNACGIPFFTPKFHGSCRNLERLDVNTRRRLLRIAQYLLDDWPQRLIEFCRANHVRSSTLLRDMEVNPFWYWDAVHEYLYGISYCPSDEETNEAANHIRDSGNVLNNLWC